MMSPLNAGPSDPARHREVWELLPWYVNGTLEGHDQETVEAHLATCTSCEAEAGRCRHLATLVRAPEEVEWAPSPAHLARLLERIEEATGTSRAEPSGRPGLAGLWDRWRRRLEITPTPFRWALAVQGALVLLLAAGLTWQLASTAPAYRTLSSARETTPGRLALVRLVLAEDITERELRELLGRVQASIVGGPSATGVYTVGLRGSAGTGSALATLRSHAKVRLAEPIAPRN